jgi:hypothetical protein
MVNISMSNPFEKVFAKVLKEAPDTEMDSLPEISDADALKSTLDGTASASDFSADDQAAQEHTASVSKLHQHMVSEITSWVQRLEQFGEFLNGTDGNSMQSKLKNALPDTIFEKIRTAESKKIARVAMEVAALNEMMKSYLASSHDSRFKGI